MKLLIPAIVAGALSGLGGALVVRSLPAPDSSTRVEPVAPGEDDDVAGLVAELRAENEELRARIEALEVRPVDVARAPVLEAPTADDELLEEMRALLAAMKTESGDLPTDFHASVARAIEDIRAVEEAERDREREEREADRIDQAVSELTVELGLSTQQASQLQDRLLTFEDQRSELRDRIRAAGDWGAARQGFADLRDEHQAALKQIFTTDQYDKYQELEGDDPFRRGFRRGGAGGAGGGVGGVGGGVGGGRRGGRGSDS